MVLKWTLGSDVGPSVVERSQGNQLEQTDHDTFTGTADFITPKHFKIICFVTDDGPDQKACSKLMSASVGVQPEVFYFRMKCVLHQLHLVVGKMLNRLQGHFSAMAKIVNVWRSVGVPYKVSQQFEKLFGHKIAQKVRRLPPRPLRGRWGSISSAEAYLLESEPKSLAGVFKAVLGSTDCDDGGDDAITLDSFSGGDMDNATYRKIMGRWRRDAISALDDPFFGCKF